MAANDVLRIRVRDGCRGGSEQFKWNSVKEQDFRDREQYLGQSTKVGMMGKFGKYHLHDWYARKRDDATSIEQERSSVQAYEEELMQEALGLKPKKLLLAKKALSDEELKEFLQKERPEGKRGREQMGPQGAVDRDENGKSVDVVSQSELSTGLGFAAHRTKKLEEYKAQALGTSSELKGSSCSLKKEEIKDEFGDTTVVKLGGEFKAEAKAESKAEVKDEFKAEARDEETVKLEASATGLKRERDVEEANGPASKGKKDKKVGKKQKKKEKKEKKAAKKLAKRAKKEAKKKKAKSSSSSDSSSS